MNNIRRKIYYGCVLGVSLSMATVCAEPEPLQVPPIPYLEESYSWSKPFVKWPYTSPFWSGQGWADNVSKPWYRVINTQEEWNLLYADLRRGQVIPPQPPVIDFEQYQVVVGGLGGRNTMDKLVVLEVGEAFIHVADINYNGCKVPSFGMVATPTAVILMKKTDKQLTFQVDKASWECN
jgi:hypothetical protein